MIDILINYTIAAVVWIGFFYVATKLGIWWKCRKVHTK